MGPGLSGVWHCWLLCLAMGAGTAGDLGRGGAGRGAGLPAAPQWRVPEPVVLALTLVLVGAVLAGWRTERVAAPVLGFRYYGPLEGRIVAIDRSLSDKLRLTLDQLVLSDTAPARTPQRVRVSLHGMQGATVLTPGARVMLTGHLSPPMGPAEPGGFDFRRMAWFLQIGAVGYTRAPVVGLEPRGRTERRCALGAGACIWRRMCARAFPISPAPSPPP